MPLSAPDSVDIQQGTNAPAFPLHAAPFRQGRHRSNRYLGYQAPRRAAGDPSSQIPANNADDLSRRNFSLCTLRRRPWGGCCNTGRTAIALGGGQHQAIRQPTPAPPRSHRVRSAGAAVQGLALAGGFHKGQLYSWSDPSAGGPSLKRARRYRHSGRKLVSPDRGEQTLSENLLGGMSILKFRHDLQL